MDMLTTLHGMPHAQKELAKTDSLVSLFCFMRFVCFDLIFFFLREIRNTNVDGQEAGEYIG